MTAVAPTTDGFHAIQAPASMFAPLERFLGLAYVTFTTWITIQFMVLLAPYIQNDYFWTDFNATGAQSYMADVYASQLWDATSPHDLGLFASGVASAKDYSGRDTAITIHATDARRIAVEQLNLLPVVVAGLRSQTASQTFRSLSSFCWLDFTQAWEVAHTTARQARCRARYSTNGAVYMESTLRNTDWQAWYVAWGGAFEIAYGRALRESGLGGEAWLNQTTSALAVHSIQEEVDYWMAHDITQYVLPWHNHHVGGVDSVILVQNALQTFPTRVSHVEYQSFSATWTSVVASFGVWNDMGYATDAGASLVRNASDSFSLLDESLSPEMWVGVYPFTNCSLLFHSSIGPLASVDLLFVLPPPSFLAVYNAATMALAQEMHTNAALGNLDTAKATTTFDMVPPRWQRPGMLYYSGNPLCLDDNTQPYVQQSFGFDDACTNPRPRMTIDATLKNIVLAIWLHTSATSAAFATLVPRICRLLQRTTQCDDALVSAFSIYISWSIAPRFPTATFNQSLLDLLALDIGLIQYATLQDTPLVLSQSLVDPSDAAWSFYGWLHLLDWVQGTREVVSFQGDAATFVLVSKPYAPQSFVVDPLQIPTRFSYLVGVLLWCMTGISALVLAVAMLWALLAHGEFSGLNLIFFRPVVGVVWMGRPLLALRGLVAMTLLSTASIQLARDVDATHMRVVRRTPLDALTASGETLWLTFALCDTVLIFLRRHYAKPCVVVSCVSVWAITLAIELSAPFTPSATVARTCVSSAMDILLVCVAGEVHVGSYPRFACLCAIQGVCVVVPCVLVRFLPAPISVPRPVIVPAMAAHVLTTSTATYHPHLCFDPMSCVLSGLIPFQAGRSKYVFSVIFWAVIPVDEAMTRVPQFCLNSTLVPPPPTSPTVHLVVQASRKHHTQQVSQQMRALAAVVFLVASATSSALFFYVLSDQLNNDFLWHGFNATGMQPFLMDWYNRQLFFAPSRLVLDMASATTAHLYNGTSTAAVQFSTMYASSMQYEHLSLGATIDSLRSMDACEVPWIASQYCWLDLGRRWEMANSAARQRRCLQAMVPNGAVYVDTLLRNVNLNQMLGCWGPALNVGVLNELQQSHDGQVWLASIFSTSKLAVADEVVAWAAHNITQFIVQWQNYKSLGVVETLRIESAVGLTYPLTIKSSNGMYRFALESSMKMYWGWGSDLWATTSNDTLIAHASLIRSSPSFAFANVSMEMVLRHNQTLTAPLDPGLTLVQHAIGPFGSVDLIHVPCPASLSQFYKAFTEQDTTVMSTAVGARAALPSYSSLLLPAPTMWIQNYPTTLGGNILCPSTPGPVPLATGLLEFMGTSQTCSVSNGAEFKVNRERNVFSLVAYGLFQPCATIDCPTLADVCSNATFNAAICLSNFQPVQTWIATYMSSTTLAQLYHQATVVQSEVAAMDVEIVQYGQRTSSSPVEFLHMNVFSPGDVYFQLFSWVLMADWATGYREVVSLQGDVGTINVLTMYVAYDTIAPNALQVPGNVAYYCQLCLQYTTAMVFVVTFVALMFTVSSRGLIEGYNMFEVNRVGGIVWVGRPLLGLRSLVAILFLATANVQLVMEEDFTRIATPTQSGIQRLSMLLAGSEMCWLIIVLTDIALLVTREHTSGYSNKATYIVTFVATILSAASPVQPFFGLDRTCTATQLDVQLSCDAGVIQIGSSRRVVQLMAATAGTICLCFMFEKWRRPMYQLPSHKPSLLLPAAGHYLYAKEAWIFGDVLYLDKASAFLAGLVAMTHHKTVYIFDIKTWRLHVLVVDSQFDPSGLTSDKFDQHRILAAVPLIE
ncbi:Aste57867_3276 [Aphanomyces stellatus]|uniref:Aste57867_3276 protein n=1 Tax=Aphanomyces stellatus TaxID=120398 RepID=A0A485K9C8_9STRA|nr:hypothetical protein As57867_003266 [Aphanomyces stellatus]VFT80448.1 Aste57867_3276 [Aphanomyces stellatus]